MVKDTVHMMVHKSFFDRVFEPARIGAEGKLGVRFSQKKFSEYLAKSNFKIKCPRQSRKFAPKRGFMFNL